MGFDFLYFGWLVDEFGMDCYIIQLAQLLVRGIDIRMVRYMYGCTIHRNGRKLVSNDWGHKMGHSSLGCKTRNRARKLSVGPAAAWVKGHEMQTCIRRDS